MKTINALLLAGIILFTACKKKDDSPEPEEETPVATTKSASFKIGGTSYTATNPRLSIFDNNGTINNYLSFTANDGSKIEFGFQGTSPATYQLQSYSNGYYKNAAGKQYNSVRGQLIITSYSSSSSTVEKKATGTFSFWAKAIVSPYDSLQITDGVITNASN
jgi:hypothetical protein